MANIFLLAVTAILVENFVFVKFYGICSQIQHRFNAENHAGFQPGAFTAAGEIGNLRGFMQFDTAAVSDIFADDTETVFAGAFFHCRADIPDKCTAFGGGNTLHQ